MSSPPYKVGCGDVDDAFKKAVHVFEDEIVQCRGGAHSIEGRGILIEYRAADDSLLVLASTQKAHDLKNSIAVLPGLSDSKIRVVTPEVGGGFGAKLCLFRRHCRCGRSKTAQALNQMDRRPARALYQCGAGARPDLATLYRH